MKLDKTVKIYKDSGFKINYGKNVNKWLKAVIVNFSDERGDIVVYNDNFGTRRKYPDFTEGKKQAGLNPLQIVYSGLDIERVCNERYIDKNNGIHYFKEIEGE